MLFNIIIKKVEKYYILFYKLKFMRNNFQKLEKFIYLIFRKLDFANIEF